MYHYVESGLANVWLSNGFVVKQTVYGKSVAITDVKGLQDVIGKAISKKPSVLKGVWISEKRAWAVPGKTRRDRRLDEPGCSDLGENRQNPHGERPALAESLP